MNTTRDKRPYTPGMTLYGIFDYRVVTLATGNEVIPGYASVDGYGVPFVNISAHYANEVMAIREAAINSSRGNKKGRVA